MRGFWAEIWNDIKAAITWLIRLLITHWLVPLWRISRFEREARKATNKAERLAREGTRSSWYWWHAQEYPFVDDRGRRVLGSDRKPSTYKNIDRARQGIFSGTDTTPRLDVGDTRTDAPDPPSRIELKPPRVVRRAWLDLAITTATWYSGQARPEDLDEWEQICRTVQMRAFERGGSKEQGWAYNELAAVNGLKGKLSDAQGLLESASAQRGHRGRGQFLTNRMLQRLRGTIEDPDLDARFGLLANDGTADLAHRLHARNDKAGRALTRLAHGATAMLLAEARVASDLRQQATTQSDRDRDDTQAGEQPAVPQVSDKGRKAAKQGLVETAKPLEEAKLLFEETAQLRAEVATRADLVLVYGSLAFASTDSHERTRYRNKAETEAKAALATHEQLKETLDRNDQAAEATLLLNWGARLVWDSPKRPQSSDPDQLEEGEALAPDPNQLKEARAKLKESLDIWEELRTKLPQAKRLQANQARCNLYLGDAAWRLAEGEEHARDRFELLSNACWYWDEAYESCQQAGDVVGAEATERRPGTRHRVTA